MPISLTQLLARERKHIAQVRDAIRIFNEKVQRTEGPVVHVPPSTDDSGDVENPLQKWVDEINKRMRAEWDARASRKIIKMLITKDTALAESFAAFKAEAEKDAKLNAELFELITRGEVSLVEAMQEVDEIEKQTSDTTVTEPLNDELWELRGMRNGIAPAEMVVRLWTGQTAVDAELLKRFEEILERKEKDFVSREVSSAMFKFSLGISLGAFANNPLKRVVDRTVDPYPDESGNIHELAEALSSGKGGPETERLFDQAIAHWQSYVEDAAKVAEAAGRARYALDYADACCELLQVVSSPEATAEREEQIAMITQMYRDAQQPIASYIGYCRMLKHDLELLKADWLAIRADSCGGGCDA